jgi:triosephosphate isomerase
MKVFLNWKQNGTSSEISNFLSLLELSSISKEIEVCLFPPFPYLGISSSDKNLTTGAQNISEFEGGSFTGEVSAFMLKDFKVKYCLVGHSERRKYFFEVEENISAKIKLLEKNGIIPVLCIGETLNERKEGKFFELLLKQLGVLTSNCLIAYEPVWAIGSGVTPSVYEIREVADFVFSKYNKKIIYGGSVNENNIDEIGKISDINGVLVGNASLFGEKVNKIVRTLHSICKQ